jgi:cholestenol delta-isomerase
MEAVTAFIWGPLSALLVHGIFAVKPWRYALMVVVSLGQVYGDVLYYGTCYLEGGWKEAEAEWGTPRFRRWHT